MNHLFSRNILNSIIPNITMKFKPSIDYRKYYKNNNRINNKNNNKNRINKNNKILNKTNLLKTNNKTNLLNISNKQSIIQSINKTIIENKHIKKETIPKRIRELVWTTHNTEVFSNKCYVSWCDNIINVFNFQVGHDIPESKGGTLDIDNLKPICGNCNLSMSNNYSIKEWSNLIKNNKNNINSINTFTNTANDIDYNKIYYHNQNEKKLCDANLDKQANVPCDIIKKCSDDEEIDEEIDEYTLSDSELAVLYKVAYEEAAREIFMRTLRENSIE